MTLFSSHRREALVSRPTFIFSEIQDKISGIASEDGMSLSGDADALSTGVSGLSLATRLAQATLLSEKFGRSVRIIVERLRACRSMAGAQTLVWWDARCLKCFTLCELQQPRRLRSGRPRKPRVHKVMCPTCDTKMKSAFCGGCGTSREAVVRALRIARVFRCE